jgi:flagellar biosynthesis protein FliR
VDGIDLTIDAAWAAGLVLSITRVAAFVVASPLIGRVVPLPGRLGVTVALGFFFASPVAGDPSLEALMGAGVVNAVIGAALGFLTGMIIHVFGVAGGIIDMTSGLAAASIMDPTRGEQGAVFNRIFHMSGLALFYVAGGLALIVRGLALSVEAIPLDGGLAPSATLAGLATRLTGRIVLAGAELALPVIAALFITEVVLGLASRFAPQANVFLLGLPAKIFIALVMSSLAVMVFPEAMSGVMGIMEDTFVDGLRGLRG